MLFVHPRTPLSRINNSTKKENALNISDLTGFERWCNVVTRKLTQWKKSIRAVWMKVILQGNFIPEKNNDEHDEVVSKD